MNKTRLEAAPIILLQSTTNRLPRPARKNASNASSNNPSHMDSSRIWINNFAFSKYECEIACAIQLYIRNANNKVPTDETLGFIIKALRGDVNGVPLPCQNMVYVIEHYDTEAVRAIYLSVYCNREQWKAEARKVWFAWLAQNDALVRRLRTQGALAPFVGRDGNLKTKD